MILVLGDAMLDEYWTGDVSRISPEAPVPVVAIEKTEERLGGAANVAENVRAMGEQVCVCFSPDWPIEPVKKLRIIGRNQQVCRIDFDHPQAPLDKDQLKVLAPACSVAVVSDYGKGALSGVETVIDILKASGCTILVDPKNHRYQKYAGADMVKPNIHEMKELVGHWDSEDELFDKVEEMRKAAHIGSVLLTRGPEGMTLFDGERTHFPSVAREVYDVSGAGDTAIAAFAVAVAQGMQFSQAAYYANKAAGCAVGHFGTAVIRRQEVFNESRQ